jgi:hypothetical protein
MNDKKELKEHRLIEKRVGQKKVCNNRFKRIALLSRFVLLTNVRLAAQTAPI